ncbi:hypothetical protein [Mycobacterium scrofulaceum]|uniref:hypothetical protein n=1 Tax=Mycobacterium scrofulaceum TaxID=1783 RepID=UPI000B15F04A|nr:hypothetical protein [Mycobacterium scrofulaceum]
MIVLGKANSIAFSDGDSSPHVVDERAGHAPLLSRPGEPEPNVTRGERLQPPQARPRRAASRTIEQARAVGLTMPEALDLSAEEVAAFSAPPKSAPDQR